MFIITRLSFSNIESLRPGDYPRRFNFEYFLKPRVFSRSTIDMTIGESENQLYNES